MGKLSTHVLDTTRGRPAAGLELDLYRLDEAGQHHLGRFATNRDGRTDAPLLAGEALTAGVYQLEFHAGAYLRALGLELPEPPFLETIPIRFGVAAGASYHVPLLLSPYGYSTYRGS